MGQRAFGILYGCEIPELPGNEAGAAAHGLVKRWRAAKNKPFEGGCWLDVRVDETDGRQFLGVWVPLRRDSKDISFRSKSIAAAAKLWERFAAHVASKEGVQLPEASLWLMSYEVS